MDAQSFAQLLHHDFSEGTEEFREALLNRCLAELDADDGEALALDCAYLDQLSAAGDVTASGAAPSLTDPE